MSDEPASSAHGDLRRYRQLVVAVLNCVPTWEEPPQTIAQIAARASRRLADVSLQDLELATAIVVVVLSAFDVSQERGGRYRCRAEMSMYFAHSLAWYIANARPLLNNWMRRGVGNDIAIGALLDAPPHLLRIAEEKRLQLAEGGIDPAPSRIRKVACVLVKTVVDGRSYFLFEWERVPAQYQLIGGGINTDEEPRAAAVQELIEEMVVEPGRHLEYGEDFDIRPLDWDGRLPTERPLSLEWSGVSRTVGALTRYEVWAYTAHLKMTQLKLREHCRWLSTREMLDGKTDSGRRIWHPVLFQLMNERLRGGLEGVPISISGEAIPDFRGSDDSWRDSRPSVFIGHGHSSSWRELAEHLRDRHGYRVITYESEQRPGQATTDTLTRLIDQASFAILVHTAEDEQPDGGVRARQNVVHETGLFQGKLGFSRAIVIRQRGCEAFSNLAGLHELHYTTDIREAFGEVVAALRREFG